MRECCVWFNVGDESVSLLVFSVCADGIFGVRDAGLSFDSCIATTSGCVASNRCLSSSTVLLMPFALSLIFFISLCFVLEVFCLLHVWGCEGLVWVLLGWRRMEVCMMGICGECRDV